jgi:DNA topoisomerase-1
VSPPRICNDPRAAARAAQLRYASADEPGFRRRRCGRGFVYLYPDGRRLTDERHLERIVGLAVPPAWTDVWICRTASGHLQATGRDARGRKQYRYHADWRRVRDGAKFEKLAHFGHALPKIRRRVRRDLAERGLSKDKVIATMIDLLDRLPIRIGNEEYVRQNESYGLCTLEARHAAVRGSLIAFDFRGKGGKSYSVRVKDRKLAGIVKRCRDLPGQRLFCYLDAAGEAQPISSSDVNGYLQAAAGAVFSAKDFRTWAGSLAAALLLADCAPGDSAHAAKQVVNETLQRVADGLGNTLAVCKRCYVHPYIVDAYIEGELGERLERARELARSAAVRGLRLDEAAVLSLLSDERAVGAVA